ncbi:MAG: ABC transporter ATP-binding protein [Rhodocyclaceae bacterium]|nr:ABC transporter ATP-binding protein [Rhodocyclaceae bacterium]
MTAAPVLAARALSVRIGGQAVADALELEVRTGERLAVLGRNGAGKTTLLHTLAGLRPPAAGLVELDGWPLSAMDGREAARLRGLLPQRPGDAFPATVLETALIGRHPHLSRWAWEGARDEAIAREALAAVGLSGLAERDVRTLSGGERQRLAFATLLAQAPKLWLLDEPLAHLDLNHQVAVLELVADKARSEGVAVVMVLHDVNLALRYADRALLLIGEGETRQGAVGEVLEPGLLGRMYGHPIRVVDDGGRPVFVPE